MSAPFGRGVGSLLPVPSSSLRATVVQTAHITTTCRPNGVFCRRQNLGFQSVRGFAARTSNKMADIRQIKDNCRKVMCIGRNYADHVKELNNQRPKQPFFFLKPPSSILLPHEGPILRPAGVNMHFEVELGLVIGKTLRDVDENDEARWLDAIESYVLAIDMTGRNVQEEAKKRGLPWSIAKGFDTFLPLAGPIEKSKIADPHNVELWLSVNGHVKQQDNTELMLFRIGRQLADISKVMTLEKGDVVLTGTPKGVGPVVTGDVIEAGLRIGGKEVEEARIKVPIKDREGAYQFTETY
ncbi:hypothetical protein AC579_1436 [Pseudocercospora musae]|uniref:Fumarylacetoacetase-like C-terminal domain-containing protein n=1 Tax=Pseudocercospora musae TaxID=113226 RepID=A0A139IMY8_9PEZI|nr:hypothetical protein AC579_1436 [Pseudocercospora musae]